MTGKDYDRVALAMRQAHIERADVTHAPHTHRLTYLAVVRSVAKTFAEQDERFNTNRFLSYCGVGGMVRKS